MPNKKRRNITLQLLILTEKCLDLLVRFPFFCLKQKKIEPVDPEILAFKQTNLSALLYSQHCNN